MRTFDYTFLERGLLPASLVNVSNAISELKALESDRRGRFPDIFSNLESIAKVQSVKSSNALEGIMTTDQRIWEIVTRSSAPLNHSEMEIAGYRDALEAIHTGHSALDIRTEDILALHRTLLSYTPEKGGSYKKADNAVIEADAFGHRRVRFAPVSAKETPAAMEQLLLAYMDARSNTEVSQLLLIPCFILDFLCIHPFADGNGRMSRLLSLLLLYKNGFDAGKYISFEEQINTAKSAYYEALRQSSLGWHENENSYFPFMENYISALLRCYKELDSRFAVVQGKRITKSRRVEAIVLNSLLPVSKAEICARLPDVSPTTVEKVLGDMTRQGRIKKVGSGRSTKYARQ
ncbi:MAG: Fic family protein [Pyramidobacter sp.]|nr:Fic family protein [Pyramidobacter sp.]